MKTLVILFGFVVGSSAMANPFDSFVGEYSIVGVPQIQKSGSAKECIRFDFPHLVGISVIRDTGGYRQSNVVRFHHAGGMGTGWSGHPIMDYNNNLGGSPMKCVGDSAVTTGDVIEAQNIWSQCGGTISVTFYETLSVSLANVGGQYLVKMIESYIENGQTVATCNYLARLSKQN